MKHTTKKITAFVLTVLLIIGMIPSIAIPATAAVPPTSGSCGENATWELDTATGTLTISGTGIITDNDKQGTPWLDLNKKITKILIEDGITSLPSYCFYGCSNASSITIPNSVTSIGAHAFVDCRGLKNIDLPNTITHIGGMAFGWCSGLTEFEIPDSVTEIASSTFIGCDNLKSITIPQNVKSIGDFAFQDCIGFTSFTIPDWITTIDTGAFYGCTNLKSIYIPNSVTSIGPRAFLNCSGLTHVTIPKSVKKISGSTFRGCTSLVSISIPNTVTEIWNNAFQDCPKLKRVILPKNIKIVGYPFWENKSATLYSYSDSTAKKYAAENDIPFVALDAKTPFKDVPNKSWYDKSVRFAYNYGLVKGITKTTFEPETPMSRAMLVTVLYRMENSPKVSTKTKFKDVKSEDWYAKAVAWASKNGIVNGMTEKTFEPNTQITRAQMVTMLYRYAQFCNRDISAKKSLKSFPDYKKVPDWAEDAMKWAIADEIINGMDGKIAPNGNATRAQVATILSRYIQQ